MAIEPTRSSIGRMRTHRARMRKKGMRPVQIWAYDTEAPGFREELEQELAAIRNSPGEQEVLDWIEAVYEWPKD